MTIARFQVPEIPAATLIDEGELEALYNFRKDTLSQPELRTFVQIPARTAADAQKVVDDLGAARKRRRSPTRSGLIRFPMKTNPRQRWPTDKSAKPRSA